MQIIRRKISGIPFALTVMCLVTWTAFILGLILGILLPVYTSRNSSPGEEALWHSSVVHDHLKETAAANKNETTKPPPFAQVISSPFLREPLNMATFSIEKAKSTEFIDYISHKPSENIFLGPSDPGSDKPLMHQELKEQNQNARTSAGYHEPSRLVKDSMKAVLPILSKRTNKSKDSYFLNFIDYKSMKTSMPVVNGSPSSEDKSDNKANKVGINNDTKIFQRSHSGRNDSQDSLGLFKSRGTKTHETKLLVAGDAGVVGSRLDEDGGPQESQGSQRPKEIVSGIRSERRTAEGESKGSLDSLYGHHAVYTRLQEKKFDSTTTGIPDKLLGYQLDFLSKFIYGGVFWSKELESLIPKGFDANDDLNWVRLVNSSIVVDMVEGCGRMQNRLITYEDGQKCCVRHRQNSDQIQGDIFSFYLGRILGISNLPSATVSLINLKDYRWDRVKSQIHLAQWNVDKPVVITKHVNDLIPAYIPSFFRPDKRRLHPIYQDLGHVNVDQMVELAQWSDLIVFDYLTGNLDRIVNNLFNKQWNPEMMNSPAHNLVKIKKTGLLLFIDNESGLLHGYRLLKKYEPFHRSLLNSICIFRKSTADVIDHLFKKGNISKLLRLSYHKNMLNPGKSHGDLPFLPQRNLKILNERIETVYNQINYCKSLYSREPTETKKSKR